MIRVNQLDMRFPLAKRYREYLLKPFQSPRMITALQGVTLEIRQGERVGFLGPNGAGKTTLLKLIAGLLLPGSGSVVIKGFNTTTDNNRARKNSSLVINEERSFYWRLTGRQNLEFFGALENLSGRILRSRVQESLELVGLINAADKRVGTYSSGMKQRLAIARGLLSDPEILILDEPSRALDPEGAQELSRLILTTLHQDLSKTLLIATHRLEEARDLCDRLCVLSHGSLTADASLESVQKKWGSLLEFYREKVHL
ncbi:ABC transporter ATP-binding protein [Marispirochaeta sp.]|jgi:ABC-2 type transport system ATP-binding protein|uniref:ABC transporter ATP-binding protein n=1 Tax=Marispirochaeta sp. TaxID=2038653 RepID=UPI0029C86067|nr:ABC transporter ATP-binding protein [Marispirochaeta sp.]